jgi:tripartite-type tricarboxylate transporter receptor subunit TctC
MFDKLVRASTTLLLLCATAGAFAQAYPSRPVRIVVPFDLGAPDTVGRLLAQGLATQMGGSFVVENKPGANGIIGTQAVASAAPDGHTLLVVSTSIVVNPSIQKKLPFDIVKDLVPVTEICSGEALILGVNPTLPAKNVQELIALTKRPGSRISYGSPGVGNTLHLTTELFKARTGAVMEHVPYKGAGPAIAALLAGDIQAMFLTAPLSLAHIRAGKIRAIGYTHTGRAKFMPDVPTMREAGVKGMEIDGGWYGLFAPAGTPSEVVGKLYLASQKALADPKLSERFMALGLNPVGNSPAVFKKFFDEQIRIYAEMVRIAGLRPE